MQKYLFILLLLGIGLSACAQPNPLFTQNTYRDTLFLEGETRKFLTYVPSSYTAKKAVPLVIMCHGTSGTGEKFWKISGWKELAEKEGFIAVFPTALKHTYWDDDDQKYKTLTKWNDGKLEHIIRDTLFLRDDVLFIRKIVDDVAYKYNVDLDRVFASGFSNGGGFVSRLSVEASDVFKAVGINSGRLHLQNVAPKAHIPVFHMFGAKEYRSKTGHPLPRTVDSIVVDTFIQPVLNPFLETFDLNPATYTSKTSKHGVHILFDDNLGTENNVYIFSLIKGLDHHYPNKKHNPTGFSAAKYYWEFFRRL